MTQTKDMEVKQENAQTGETSEGREKKERKFEILFLKFINEPKVPAKDVVNSLYRAVITLFFFGLGGFSLQWKHNSLQQNYT